MGSPDVAFAARGPAASRAAVAAPLLELASGALVLRGSRLAGQGFGRLPSFRNPE